MADGKSCPVCSRDIGVWAIFAAGVPNRIRCPHCGARLRYDGAIALMAVPFVVVVLATLVAHEAAVDVGVARPGFFVAVLLLVTWIPIELLLAIYLRDHRTLQVVEPRPGKPKGA